MVISNLDPSAKCISNRYKIFILLAQPVTQNLLSAVMLLIRIVFLIHEPHSENASEIFRLLSQPSLKSQRILPALNLLYHFLRYVVPLQFDDDFIVILPARGRK